MKQFFLSVALMALMFASCAPVGASPPLKPELGVIDIGAYPEVYQDDYSVITQASFQATQTTPAIFQHALPFAPKMAFISFSHTIKPLIFSAQATSFKFSRPPNLCGLKSFTNKAKPCYNLLACRLERPGWYGFNTGATIILV